MSYINDAGQEVAGQSERLKIARKYLMWAAIGLFSASAVMGIFFLWFGTDDAATSTLTPIYCNTTEVPWCLSEENGSMLHYSPTSMFWVTNRIANFAYLRYNVIGKRVREEVDKWENDKLAEVAKVDAKVATLSPKKAQKLLTDYSIVTAQALFEKWDSLDKYLLVKFIDGNTKAENEKGFIDNGNGKNIPDKIEQSGYSEKWKRAVVEDNGEVLKVR